MNFKSVALIASTALVLISCGRQEAQFDSSKTKANVTSPIVPVTTVVTNPVPNPVPTAAITPAPTVGGCGPSNPENPYSAPISGTGPYKASGQYVAASFDRPIIADQTFRVSLRPIGSGANSTAGGSQNYGKMAVRVTLLRDGVAVASKDIAGLPDSTGYKTGIAAGTYSDPAIADFRSYLRSGSNYSIRVSNIQTDWTCKIACTANNSNYGCAAYGSGYDYACYNSYSGYKWNWDYNSGGWFCCSGDLLKQCQQLQCGVGFAQNTAGWAGEIMVETDNTKCIQ